MKSKIIFWMLSFLYSVAYVTAFHGGGGIRNVTPNPGTISPIGWMFIIAILIGVGYFFYWIFSKGEKKF